MSRQTHVDRVLKYLEDFGSITSLDAFKDLGNTRLSASIWILRHKYNMEIDGIIEESKNRYGDKVHYNRYYLKGSLFEQNLKNKGAIE